jgi:hypothetical protein
MRKITIVFLGFFIAISRIYADEGMWLLPLVQKLNIDTMHSLGLKLNAEDIYSINHSSLKDAIVIFDQGCTGEIVSHEGLLLTNHHCGYDAIQAHSSMEHNYLEDGFWAKTHEEELPNKGLKVTFLVRVEDVTDAMLQSVPDTLNEFLRTVKIEVISDSLSNEAIKGTHFNAEVYPMFGGNRYFLFVYEVFSDVRFVGAPPSSIGKFGYDTDNWMWPRHTGDFSVFRVYTGPNGEPAEYSKDNIPLKPRHSLPVSLKPKNIDDYTMILGYPGSTDRYMTSYEIDELMRISNPNRIKIRGLRLEILMKDMRAEEQVNIKYASKYSVSSNYWKYSIGQNQGLKRLALMQQKQAQEAEFISWVKADPQREKKYGNALELIKNAVQQRAIHQHTLEYTYECFFNATEIIAFANKAVGLYATIKQDPGNQSLIDSLALLLKYNYEEFYKDYNAATDMKVIPAILELYKNNVPDNYLPGIYTLINQKFKGDYTLYTNNMFERSIFTNKQRFNTFIQKPSAKVLEKDPAFQAAIAAMETYRKSYFATTANNSNFDKGHRLYIAGLLEMHPDKVYYPDANFTMRLTYGTVQDYFARDAVHYAYATTLKGVMEKEDPDNWEFVVPQKLKDMYASKDFGIYGANNEMPVCFLTNNDITGGNSGSPVIDDSGNLIGLAFDGNWEAMSSDIAFEPKLQRCICVDIRYVLFIMDKFAGASHLVKEMEIIR